MRYDHEVRDIFLRVIQPAIRNRAYRILTNKTGNVLKARALAGAPNQLRGRGGGQWFIAEFDHQHSSGRKPNVGLRRRVLVHRSAAMVRQVGATLNCRFNTDAKSRRALMIIAFLLACARLTVDG